MLEQLSDQIRVCYERAAEAKAKADATDDPTLKAEFLETEMRWLILARRLYPFIFAEVLHGLYARASLLGFLQRLADALNIPVGD